MVIIGMKYTKDGYWRLQVENLKHKSNRELQQLIEAFSKFEIGDLHNYYEHVRKEYASRIGKQ